MSVTAAEFNHLTPSDRIFLAMRRRRLRAYQLAGMARIRPATLSRMLREDEPSLTPEQRDRVARVLRVPVGTLFPEDAA